VAESSSANTKSFRQRGGGQYLSQHQVIGQGYRE